MLEQEIHFPPFRPKRLIAGPHAQTIGSLYFPYRFPDQPTREHIVRLDDGDRIVVHENRPSEASLLPLADHGQHDAQSNRVVLLIHGLGGTHRSLHVARLAYKLSRHGCVCLRMDQRGCGRGLALAKRPTHAGRSNDLRQVVSFVRSQWPERPITLIGFSLGGNLLLKLLAEYGSQVPAELDSAVAVAPPINLAACSENLKQGLNWFYDRVFLKSLTRIVSERRRQVVGCVDFEFHSQPTTLFEFDELYTAPLAGFRDAEEYYAACSTHQLLESISVKTWIITSRDDPLVPFQIFSGIDLGSKVSLHATDHGGHLGFLARSGIERDPFWLDWRLEEIIASLPVTV